jgi:hypothetical protein
MSDHHEIDYEVEQRGTAIKIRATCDELDKVVRHTSNLTSAREYPGGIDEYVEDRVEDMIERALKAKKEKERSNDIDRKGKMEIPDPDPPKPEDELGS